MFSWTSELLAQFYQPKVKKPKKLSNKLHSLTLSKKQYEAKNFTNRLAVPEGFYNIHTTFQALHLMQILPIL